MNEEIIVEEETIEIPTAVSPTNTSRRLVMASIGFASIIRGELSSTLNRVIEQGETETAAQATRRFQQQPIRRTLKKPVNKILRRLNIPTKSDIDALNNQIGTLLEKVESLQTDTTPPTRFETEISSSVQISENA